MTGSYRIWNVRAGCCLLAILSVCVLGASATRARELTLEERMRAQRRIEAVYWAHRIWPEQNPTPKPPLEEVLSDRIIRERVENYLAKSRALDEIWNRPVSVRQLLAETERMRSGTRYPELLRALFAALDDDRFLIAECLARPVLVDRLIHNWYAHDDRFRDDGIAPGRSPLDKVEPLDGDSLEGFRDWWRIARRALGPDAPVREALSANRIWRIEERRDPATTAVPEGECAGWQPLRFAVEPRSGHTAVWTGSEMIVWGGFDFARTGARYDPATDHWTLTSGGRHVPRGSEGHTVVWTGTEMILWGGNATRVGAPTLITDGARYNPSTNAWFPMADGPETPAARIDHTAVWTGSEMIVWGGDVSGGVFGTYVNSGGRYRPATDTWRATSSGPGVPSARELHTAVWTGSEMIVWGGYAGNYLATGGRYDPSTDGWTPTSSPASLLAVSGHSAAWTGDEMVVWGGANGSGGNTNRGARYDPAADDWTPTSTAAGVPQGREGHTAIWTGSEMIVWGGTQGGSVGGLDTGGRYDPATDGWTPTSTINAPDRRFNHTTVWTGSEMIVWGGISLPASRKKATGGRYDPATDSWVPTTTGPFVPVLAQFAEDDVVWTGTEAIRSSGDRYDPATDTWTPSSAPAAPNRLGSRAVWTGDEMIVWGGFGEGDCGAGVRYNPTTDVWTPTATNPFGLRDHTAVWTGSEMIAWGGNSTSQDGTDCTQGGLADYYGYRYEPASDTWKTTRNAPATMFSHTSVWSGSEMLVFGQAGAIGPAGERYDPAADSWSPMSTGPGYPGDRTNHTAVWTGSEMIVWGGREFPGFVTLLNDGARYDPVADTWSATSLVGAPDSRSRHTAVWTGSEMIVWGNVVESNGGMYDPSTDTWLPTAMGTDVPTPRVGHVAAWTGTAMFVWGGYFGATTGGSFCPCAPSTWYADRDADDHGDPDEAQPACRQPPGYVLEDTDCDDLDPENFGGNTEICDGRDNDCNGLADDGLTADADGDGHYVPGSCIGPADDCDDANPDNFPGNREFCDDLDNDCDGVADEGLYDDADGDGHTPIGACIGSADDCDDTHASVHPGAPEICDGLDSDCNGVVPAFEADGDGDGSPLCADCDDGDPGNFPGNREVCDDRDNDCDGLADEGLYDDADGDGQTPIGACIGTMNDCDDHDPAIFFGAPETCDGRDTNCDAVIPIEEIDLDGDGTWACAGDCDEDDRENFSGNVEFCDGRDNDCDGLADEDPAGPRRLTEPFDGTPGDDPADWLDTGANDSLDPADDFEIALGDGTTVLGTVSPADGIHSHYARGAGWSEYTYQGRLRLGDPLGGIGVTFLSNYPVADHYYALVRSPDRPALQVSNDPAAPHGMGPLNCDVTDTGVDPADGAWYRFEIKVQALSVLTAIRVKAWKAGSAYPETWQQFCVDTNFATRRSAGTVGVSAAGPGFKQWDNLAVSVAAGTFCGVDGIGVCSTGIEQCLGGAPVCTGTEPSSEVCDGLDNDCDGTVDEDAQGLDTDADGVTNACDNCPDLANPDQAPIVFGRQVLAASAQTFVWPNPTDVEFVRGPLSLVSVFGTDLTGSAPQASSLTDPTVPPPGEGRYYLIRLPAPCGSWQNVLGAEPQRDAVLHGSPGN